MAQRVEWTDDRLTDKMVAVDATFERIDTTLRELRAGQTALAAQLTSEIGSLRSAASAEQTAVRASIDLLRDRIMVAGFTLSTALIAAAVAVVLKA